MMISNNSSLLKDSQELTKTKQTIWKPLIAVSLLSIFSFISGQYLPYVIIAVSGSGPIAAVPLAIFAVSTVVAFISVTYLVKLAISRDDNKKEVGLNGQKFGHTPSQEPQKFVCKNCTNLENKSNVPTPQSPPVTLGTQPNPSVSVPPPPPPPLPQDAALPPPPPHFFTASKRTEQPKNDAPKKAGEPENNNHSTLFEQIRGGTTLKRVSSNKSGQQQNFTNELKAKLESSGGTDKKETPEEFAARIDREQAERKKSDDNDSDWTKRLKERAAVMQLSDSESEHSDSISDSDWTTDESKDTQKEIEQEKEEQTKHTNSPSSKEEGSGGLDSGIGSRATSPIHPEQETEESPVPPSSCVDSPQVNNVDSVDNEVQDSPPLSVEDRIAQFGGKALRCQKENVVQGL
ncbi:hypothetical protein [Wolbachia endosymbiont (group A) of Nomada hirtipes]|uniref:hypothetical protein n=1 Tax=Wolbachia endosymbiont (group A) of Nomada hirtipes TaxID=3066208 RepID=UPI0030CC4F63